MSNRAMNIPALLLAASLAMQTPVRAADATYCEAYARSLAQLLIPMVIRRAESTCGLAEVEPGPPLPKDWIAALRIVDPASTPIVVPPDIATIGVVPAQGRPELVTAPDASADRRLAASPSRGEKSNDRSGGKPEPIVAKPMHAALSPGEVCARAHRRIAWQGKSWRCIG